MKQKGVMIYRQSIDDPSYVGSRERERRRAVCHDGLVQVVHDFFRFNAWSFLRHVCQKSSKNFDLLDHTLDLAVLGRQTD
jgi:hypothetical protein